MGLENHEGNDYMYDLDLDLLSCIRYCVSYPIRSGCRAKIAHLSVP